MFMDPTLGDRSVTCQIHGDTASGCNGTGSYSLMVQVVVDNLPCVRDGPQHLDVNGVLDRNGCPHVDPTFALSIDSMHPEFHCFPWPASVFRVDDDNTRYFQSLPGTEPDELDQLPADLMPVSGSALTDFGEIFIAESDLDAIFMRRLDGIVERWPQEDFGCA